MSALRQRSGDKLESNNRLTGKPAEGAGRKVDVAATPTYPFSWTFFGLVVVSLTMSLILFKLYPSESEQEHFVPSYALCSPDGRHIYTVDQSNTRVQCLVVHKSLIFDAGSLSTVVFCSSHKCSCSLPLTEDVTHHWEEYSAGLPLSIHYLEPGSIVVPGISGMYIH
jgi:hypothetical protein